MLHIVLDIFILYVSANIMLFFKRTITDVEIIFIEKKKLMFKFLSFVYTV